MSAALISFAHQAQPRKPTPKVVLQDANQELRALQEHSRQLHEQYEAASQIDAKELLELQARVLELLSLQKSTTSSVDSTDPTNQYGYPRPSSQQSPPADATGKHYFVDEAKWQAILDHGRFDDIVCGSGPCALAYVDKALKLDSKRKILILERGGFWIPTHFQNLPLPFKLLLGSSETFPWSLTSKTFHSDIQMLLGACPFFGGRSLFWSAWSPQPGIELMRNFPPSLLKTTAGKDFWKDCKELLHVIKADELGNEEYRNIQKYIDNNLKNAIAAGQIPTAEYADAAPLSVGRTTARSKQVFEKFSTPGPLLDIYERQLQLSKEGKGHPLAIATDVTVERFYVDPDDPQKRANVLQTSRGALCFPGDKPNIILATGAVPSCTLVLNSVLEQKDRAGSRLAGHFLARINARFPMTLEHQDGLEIAASYLSGHDPTTKLQYHADITVVFSPHPKTDAADAARLCPDYFAAPSAAQLAGSSKFIVVACVMLGEIDETNPNSWVKRDDLNPDVTTNVKVQIELSDKDKSLRETMYKATLDAIQAMAGDNKDKLEYWHGDPDKGQWTKEKPGKDKFMMAGMCHEGSTLYLSDVLNDKSGRKFSDLEKKESEHASVDSDYRVYGTGNVYATGSAIFPTVGSWNPTLTNCGFAQDLAHKLHAPKEA